MDPTSAPKTWSESPPRAGERLHRRANGRDPRPDRRQEGAAGAVRRRGLVGGGGAADQSHRQAAHLRAREPRPHAQGRKRAGGRRVPEPARREPRVRGRHRPLPRPARRRGRARGEAQDHRRRVHPRVRGGGPQGWRRGELPRAGHHLSRHPGVRRREGAPQRGRPARRPAVRAVRAREALVQGRGARHRPRARATRGHGRRQPSGPGPRRALPRRHHGATASRRCARPTPSCATSSPRPASRARCGSTS